MNSSQRNRGYIYIIIGAAVLFFFAGPLLVPLLATLIGYLCINYGLELLGQPPLLITLQRFFDEIRYRFRR